MNKTLIFLLVAVFFKQIAWSTFLPLWQTPDEQAHFGEVSLFTETGAPKKTGNNLSKEIFVAEQILGTDRDEFGNNKFTYHPEYKSIYSKELENEVSSQPLTNRKEFVKIESTGYPPLYYQLASLVEKTFYKGSIFDRIFAIRIAGSLIFLALVFACFKIGELLFENKTEALYLSTLVGFQPMLTFVHSGVTSDALFNLLFTVFLLFCLRLIKRGFNFADVLALCLVVVLSFWTKPQANIMAFILLPLFGILSFREFKNKKISFLWLIAPLLIVIFSFQGIIWRLTSGLSLFPETGTGTSSDVTLVEHARFTMLHTYREVLPWFWGVFRWLSLGLPDILRKITSWLTIISMGGFSLYIVKSIKIKKTDRKFWKIIFLIFSGVIYFAAISAFDFDFRRTHGYSFGIQGRYFFPVIVPFTALFLIGLRPLAKYLAVGMILLSIAVFLWVIGSYYEVIWPSFFVQASQYKPLWLKYPVNLVILGLYLVSSLWICLLLLRPTMKKK